MKIFKTLLPMVFILLTNTALAAPRDESIQTDLLMTRIITLLKAQKEAEALPYFEQLESLNVALPESFYFYYIDALDKSGNVEKAFARCEQYMSKYGRKGKYYAKVLPIYARSEDAHRAAEAKAKAEEEANRQARLRVEDARRAAEAKVEADRQAGLRTEEEATVAFNKFPEEMVLIPASSAISSFYIGQSEVTQALWRALMGNNPSNFMECGSDCPVERVKWDDVQQFIQRLNIKTGKTYRLPTTGEWEYACLAGRSTAYCGGDNLGAVGWYDSNSDRKTHAVRGKQANAFGLYDMTGNVSEWTDSCHYGDCALRVIRGGSFVDFAYARATVRNIHASTFDRFLHVGFRLARTAP